MNNYKVSIILDQRTTLKDGRHPVKIRVHNYATNKGVLVSCKLSMSENDFNNAWSVSKKNLKEGDKPNADLLEEFETRAKEALNGLPSFNIKKFKNRLFRTEADKSSLLHHYNNKINQFKEGGRIGSAENYASSFTSLLKFRNTLDNETHLDFSFYEITSEWLYDYENYMRENGRSITTVAIYTRALRVIYNIAIKSKDIFQESYPFGRDKDGLYQIPTTKKVKKALTRKQVGDLYNTTLPPLQDKARDFWFFSYACQAINFKDIALLRYDQFTGDYFEYERAKTKIKKRTEITKIKVEVTEVAGAIIKKWGNKSTSGYVFPILSEGDSPEVIHRKKSNFIRSINTQLKHIADKLNFDKGFSTYWARHSMASNLIEQGASIEFVSEALNHSGTKITEGYLSGFEEKTKREVFSRLLDFKANLSKN